MENVSRPEYKKAFIFFLGLIFWLPWLLGGNRPWAWPIISAWAFGLFSFWLFSHLRSSAELPSAVQTARIPLMLLTAWLLYLLFQTLPMPIWLLDIINPASARAYQMADPQAAFGSISVERGMTMVAFFKSATYAVIFFLVLVLVKDKSRLELLIWLIIITALLESVYGFSDAGAKTIFGFWKKAHTTVSGSYPNRNHFAGLIQMAISLNLGVLLYDILKKRYSRRITTAKDIVIDLFSGRQLLIVGSIVILLSALMLSASRGGVLAFLVSLTLVLLFSSKIKNIFGAISTSALIPAMAGVVTVLVTAQLFLLRLLEGGVSGREYVWKPGLQMAADYGLLGSGLGTFQLAFPAYYSSPSQTWWHAHMDYLELFIELGAFGSLLFFAAILSALIILVISFIKRQNIFVLSILFGIILGVISILLHEVSDYHFYIPANAAYFFVLLAAGIVTTSVAPSRTGENAVKPKRIKRSVYVGDNRGGV